MNHAEDCGGKCTPGKCGMSSNIFCFRRGAGDRNRRPGLTGTCSPRATPVCARAGVVGKGKEKGRGARAGAPRNAGQRRPCMYCATASISFSDMRKAMLVMMPPSLARALRLKSSNCFCV